MFSLKKKGFIQNGSNNWESEYKSFPDICWKSKYREKAVSKILCK